jgi:hypothetical protein
MSAGLRRFRDPKPLERAGERCEMCAAPIGDEHPHVVDVESRGLRCACRPCHALFSAAGAARGRYRSVPDRHRYVPRFALADRVWASAGIPVGMAFLFANSASGEVVAFYPSPAGATESMLPDDVWRSLLADNPEFADIAPDVEALLITRGDDGFEAFLVPIDACYRLVGLVRTVWKGFDGGTDARAALDGFFERLRSRSGRVEAAHG